MKKETKTLIITWVAVITLIACVVGATYAYFTSQMGEGTGTTIDAQTGTTDSLKFSVGSTLSIVANQENFAQGLGNQTDSTTSSVELIANNTTNSATYTYNVLLDISKNELKYTTEEKKAELILQVTRKENDGTEVAVESIPGLNKVTVGDVTGFDITEAKDLVTIASNYEIKAEADEPTAKATQEWNVTLTFVNLETNQVENAGKMFTAKLLIQQ